MASAYESNTSADRKFVRTAMKAPMLEQEHELNLARRWREHQDEAALHELTTAYMRLVVSMAARFRNYGLPMSDLISEGNVGLMQAAARFEPSREVRFSTYATWWIRAGIQDYVLRNWSIVRTGTTSAQKSLFFNLRRLRAQIDDTDDGVMSKKNTAWVSEHLGVPVRDVESMASRMSASDRSLNAPMAADGDGQWQDLIADESAIPDALKALNERETHIILQRRLCEDGVTLEALGHELGISKERVRQIEHQALGKLRKALVRIVGDPETSGLIPNV